MKNKYIYICLTSLLTSCGRAVYQESTVEIPNAWQSEVLSDFYADSSTETNWWENFQDSILNELMDYAKKQNLDMKMASLNTCPNDACEVWANVSFDVAKSYIELRGLQKKKVLLEQNMELEDETLFFSQDLLKRGFINESDYNQLQSEKLALEAQIPTIELDITKSIYHISTLLGYAPHTLLECLSTLSGFPLLPNEISIGTPCDLLSRRSDVKKAAKNLAKASSGVALLNSRLRDLAVYNYQKTVLDALEETENAISTFRQEEKHLQYLKGIEQKLRSNLELSLDLNKRGIIDNFIVIKAKKAHLIATIEKIQSEQNLLLNYVLLSKALGKSC